MNITDKTLLQQMRITESEVESRKALLSFTSQDVDALRACSPFIHDNLESIVTEFYRQQTSITEIALLIGDADTLSRLRYAQRKYIIDIFSGIYDLEYVNNRLRIGLVHKRIGVEPKLYLSAVYTLKKLLRTAICTHCSDGEQCVMTLDAFEKIMLFDVTFVFETYIRSLVSEIEIAKDRSERYAREMEERKLELEQISSTDPLTGLLNARHIKEVATTILRAAQSRAEPVTFIFFDINNFKQINDTHGHQQGDEVLKAVSVAIRSVVREKDHCFRYGGDEFLLMLPNCTEQAAGDVLIPRINDALHRHLPDVAMSMGLAQAGPNLYPDIEHILQQADANMYAMKRMSKQES